MRRFSVPNAPPPHTPALRLCSELTSAPPHQASSYPLLLPLLPPISTEAPRRLPSAAVNGISGGGDGDGEMWLQVLLLPPPALPPATGPHERPTLTALDAAAVVAFRSQIPNVAADAFPAAIGVDPNMSGDCDVLSPDGFSQVFDNSWYRNSSGSTLTISPSSNCYSI
uniref:Uncharacterized protein n=1 Tax=Oryza glumipatula TaxID=40148 RepID=A0A0E0B0S2_9ORYZ